MPEWRLQHTRESYRETPCWHRWAHDISRMMWQCSECKSFVTDMELSYRQDYIKNIPTPRTSWIGQRDDDGLYGNIFDRAVLTYESAQPCGCDAGANWICERHRNG